MLNAEGGIDPLEYPFCVMVDRVATTGTVWMGLTTGCAQCHTHKYDAISHAEYYPRDRVTGTTGVGNRESNPIRDPMGRLYFHLPSVVTA